MEQHSVGNIEQRSTQRYIFKCPELDQVSKVICILCDGNLQVLVNYIQKLTREEIGGLSAEIVNNFKETDDDGNYRWISLLSIPWKEPIAYCSTHDQPWRKIFWGRMWVPSKSKINGYHLVVTNTGEIHWIKYDPLNDICQLSKNYRRCG